MNDYFIGITDKGKQREKNEDTFIVQEVFNNKFLVACVIDGVGGYSGGDVAADIARTVILEKLQGLSGNVIEELQQAISAANAKILHEKKGSEKNGGMACVLTCAIADIKNNKLYYAHVGDTRLYLLRDHSLVKISKDHSVVGFLEESGRFRKKMRCCIQEGTRSIKRLGLKNRSIALPAILKPVNLLFFPATRSFYAVMALRI